jgi:hypothetical protein
MGSRAPQSISTTLPTNAAPLDCPPPPAQRVTAASALSGRPVRYISQRPSGTRTSDHGRVIAGHVGFCMIWLRGPHQTSSGAHRAELGRLLLQSRPAIGGGKALRARIVK